MTNSEILQKVIHKAVMNGWSHPWGFFIDTVWHGDLDEPTIEFIQSTYDDGKPLKYFQDSIDHVIFSLDFAKAFFGTHTIADCGNKLPTEEQLKWYYDELDWLADQHGKVLEDKEWVERSNKHTSVDFCTNQDDSESPCNTCEAWEYHLPVLVMQKNRLKYLEKFI